MLVLRHRVRPLLGPHSGPAVYAPASPLCPSRRSPAHPGLHGTLETGQRWSLPPATVSCVRLASWAGVTNGQRDVYGHWDGNYALGRRQQRSLEGRARGVVGWECTGRLRNSCISIFAVRLINKAQMAVTWTIVLAITLLVFGIGQFALVEDPTSSSKEESS